MEVAALPGPFRIIVDAGLPTLADRIADVLGALSVAISVNVLNASQITASRRLTSVMGPR
jgi:hypothetical protein